MRTTKSIMLSNLIVLVSLCLCVCSLKISPPLEDKFVVLGKPLWWTCNVVPSEGSSLSTVSFIWRFQDGDMSSDTTRIVYGNGTLYFPQVLNSHIGQYTCVASDSKSAQESSAWLRAAYISTNVELKAAQSSVLSGNVIRLECQVDARPAPQIDWTFQGRPIVRTSRVSVVSVASGHSLLQINNASYENAGSYTCLVSHVSLSQPLQASPAVVQVIGPPVITTGPKSQYVPVGYNVTFTCQGISQPAPQVSWQYEPKNATSQIQLPSSQLPNVVIDSNGNLQLYTVSDSSAGTYSCSLVNQYGSATSEAILFVGGQPQPPIIIAYPSDTSVLEGTDLLLNCLGQGNPTPTVTWTHPSGVIMNASRQLSDSSDVLRVYERSTVNGNGLLTLKNVTRSDMGLYVCKVVSSEGDTEARAYVDVYFKPYFIETSSSLTVTEGDDFELFCHAAGNPSPSLSWRLPGATGAFINSSTSAGDVNSNEHVFDDGTLHVQQAERKHHGIFTCMANNSVGSANSTISVSVIGRPQFSVIPTSQGVIEGDNVSIVCQVNAYPAGSVTWMYLYMADPSIEATDIVKLKESLSMSPLPLENMTIVEVTENPRYSYLNGTSLEILDVQEETDAGLYICMASNTVGSVFEPAVLRVITFPHFQVAPTDKKANIGSTVMLHCFVVGIPVPTQRWLFNNTRLVMNDKMSTFINGSLLIQNVQQNEFGNYTCLATNQAGQRSASAKLIQSKLPVFVTPPTNVSATEGSTITLPCRGDPSLPLEVAWYISNNNGEQVEFLGRALVDGSNNDLFLDSPLGAYISDKGDLVFPCLQRVGLGTPWYMCSLSNSEGSTTSQPVYLTLTYVPDDMALTMPTNTIYNFQAAIMSCNARGYPPPTIWWITPSKYQLRENYNSGKEITVQQSSDMTISSLTIKNADTQSDAGVWTCKACNDKGCRLVEGNLIIQGRAVVRQITSVEYDTEYSISCTTAGAPLPNITYSYLGTAITDLEGHRLQNGIIFVQKDEVKSQYTCEVSNQYGILPLNFYAPSSTDLSAVKPGSLSAVAIVEHTAGNPSLPPDKIVLQYKTGVSGEWQNYTHSISQNIDDYLDIIEGALTVNETSGLCNHTGTTIKKREVAEGSGSSENLKVSVTSTDSNFVYSIEADIQNLSPNTQYDVRAAMGNALGLGPFSLPVSVITLAAAPAPVTDLSVSVQTRTAAVTWKAPDPLNGRPEDSTITVELFDLESNLIQEAVLSVLDPPEYSFPNLQPGEYSVRVTVSNKLNNATSTVAITVFTVKDGVPFYILELDGVKALNSNTVQVNWSAPSHPETLIPPVLGYVIQIFLVENEVTKPETKREFRISDTSETSFIIYNLSQKKKYSVRIACTNSAGTGPYSQAGVVETPYTEFSEDPMNKAGHDTSWKLVAIIVICVCSVLIIVTIVVILSHQIKLAKSKSVDLTPQPEHDSSDPTFEDFNGNDRTMMPVDGYRNESFIMY